MQKNILKHQFENFTTASNESLDKAYDRFQELISQLEVHGAPVSKEYINQKFLRSLPPSWSQIALIMRNKPNIDQQIDEDDLEEFYLRWQVDMLTVRVKKFIHKTGRNLDFKGKQHVTLDKRNAPISESSSQALVAQDGLGGYDWSNDFEVEPVNYALMAISSSSSLSSSDNEFNWDVPNDKNGLGYGTQMDEISNKSETDSEISMSVFEVRSSDEETTPTNDRFKADGYHAVPPPITGNFLTPRADISFAGLDEYAIRKKIIESKITKINTKTSKTVGKTNAVITEKPKSVCESVVSNLKINRDKVIIEDWNSDDEDDVSEVQIVSPVKTNETQTAKTQVDKSGQISQKEGIGFKKIKYCFVCKSIVHLIKDCNFYDKRSQEPKMKTVANTDKRIVKPVWDNAKRVNHQKFSNKLEYPQARRNFVPLGVLNRTGLVNPVKPNEKRAVHTVSTARPVSTTRPVGTSRPFILKIAQTGSAIRPIYPRMDNVRPRATYSTNKRSYFTKPAFRPKNLKQDVKTFGVQNMTTTGTRAVVNTEIFLQGHVVVDSSCSSHMTGNKAYLSDYEDYNGGFMAFGSDPKRDKLNFKLLDESQVVLRAPRLNDVYSLDLKNIVLSGGLENQMNHKVKIIRCDHGTEFKNYAMNEFCAKKGIKREFSVARTPQQNGVTERKNRTLIKPAKTMLADSLLPIPFWAEAVNTACYDSEDDAEKEEQHKLTEAEQALKDDIKKLVTQEMVSKAMDDATR
ncbi:ribonuclease H-like domain-containing protein [Tanacetum coccineum]